jgi:hypothetical protein
MSGLEGISGIGLREDGVLECNIEKEFIVSILGSMKGKLWWLGC